MPLGFPHVEVEPASLGIDVDSGSVGTTTFLVKNTGTGVLIVYTIEDDASWLTVDPASFQVPTAAAQTVTVTIDAAALPAGIYNQVISISCNDPDQPDVAVPIRVHVTEPVGVGLWEPDRVLILCAPVPNPFTISTEIRFNLTDASLVVLTVHDLLGRVVTTLAHGVMPPGSHMARWGGTNACGDDVAPGFYRIRLMAGDVARSVTVVLVH